MSIWTYIWIALAGALLIGLWWKGDLARLSVYVQETWAELKKCNWPTWAELKGSTVVVAISIALLGLFTVAADYVFVLVVNMIS
jgi:preprotein translocase subunit SecE